MPGIAMHNFRGFDKTKIFFSDVNFFIGENSTGKTSVLSAIEILSNPRFFFSGELSSEYCDFSAFDDSVSDMDPKSKFSLGYYRSNYLTTKTGFPDVAAFHFINKNGLSWLSTLYYLANGFLVKANFKQDRVILNVYHAKIESQKPVDALEKLMWGIPNKLAGETVGRFSYLYKSLPMPSPIIVAMNILALEKIKKEDADPIARARINTSLFPDLRWGAPIRARPDRVSSRVSRTYSPEGDHIPSIIRRAYGEQKDLELKERIFTHVQTFGKESHLFDDLNVKEYGIGHSAPFEVRVKFEKIEHKLENVGYGVSQAIPVLVEVAASKKAEVFVIQQPEVHLHPRAQAAFGDFFFEMATQRSHKFFIETHSDFLIDRFRLNLNQSRARKKPTAQLLFFSKNLKNKNSVENIKISNNGSFSEKLPEKYKTFFFKEELSLLGIR